jgi:hypothetical protein
MAQSALEMLGECKISENSSTNARLTPIEVKNGSGTQINNLTHADLVEFEKVKNRPPSCSI